jgi:hypothetical protein
LDDFQLRVRCAAGGLQRHHGQLSTPGFARCALCRRREESGLVMYRKPGVEFVPMFASTFISRRWPIDFSPQRGWRHSENGFSTFNWIQDNLEMWNAL